MARGATNGTTLGGTGTGLARDESVGTVADWTASPRGDADAGASPTRTRAELSR